MANHDLNAELVSQLFLDLLLPQPVTAIVAAAGVGQNQQLVFTAKAWPAGVSLPLGNGTGGKLRCIIGIANVDIALVMGQVINAIRHSPTQRILTKVMDMDLFRLLGPLATLIAKVADELLLLGIDTDNRIAIGEKQLLDPPDVAELFVPVGMIWASQTFAIAVESIFQFLQQAAHRRWPHPKLALRQLPGNGRQTAPHPFLLAHWVTSHIVSHHFFDSG